MNSFSIKKIKNMPVEAKASLAYTICSILQRALGLITLPLFTRLLTTDQYGQLTVYESWVGLFTIIITLNLPYGSFSKAMVEFEDRRHEYVNAVNIISVVFAIFFGTIYTIGYDIFSKWVKLPLFLIFVMIAQIVAECSLQCWYGHNRFEYKYKIIVAVTMLVSVAAPVLAFIAVVNTEEKGIARIIGCAVVTICVGGILLIKNLFKTRKLPGKDLIKYALVFNVPLIPYYFSQTIFNQSDRIMIDYYCGTDKAGIYGVAYTLAMLLTFILTSINASYVPWLYQQFKNDNGKANKRVSIGITALMAIMLLAVIWISPEIIFIMAGEEYAGAIWVVPPVAISLLLLAITQQFVNIEFYFEEKKSLVWASIGSAVINVILNAVFIPEFGYYAAGYTTLVSYILFCVMNYFAVHKHVKRGAKLEGTVSILGMVIIFVAMMLLTVLGMLLYDDLLVRICIMAIVFVILLVKLKDIIDMIKFVEIE